MRTDLRTTNLMLQQIKRAAFQVHALNDTVFDLSVPKLSCDVELLLSSKTLCLVLVNPIDHLMNTVK